MNAKLKIAINIVVWGAILAYSIFAVRYCSRKQEGITCKGARIEIEDSSRLGFVTPQIVRNILVNAGVKVTGQQIADIDLVRVEKELCSKAYIRSCKAYTSMDGYLNIEVKQRTPRLQIRSENGYNIYISDDNYVLPIQSYFFVDVPIVTGVVELPFSTKFVGEIPKESEIEKKDEKNYKFLYNLINFVGLLESDSYWKSQIVQINTVKGTQIELIPRVGNYVIWFGGLDNCDAKLKKLLAFYQKGIASEGWSKFKNINIEYANQVVCTR